MPDDTPADYRSVILGCIRSTIAGIEIGEMLAAPTSRDRLALEALRLAERALGGEPVEPVAERVLACAELVKTESA